MSDHYVSAIREKLESLEFPRHALKVFGQAGRLYVTVECFGADTATRWHNLFVQAFTSAGCEVKTLETWIPAAENKGSNLNPTMRRAFRIYVSPARTTRAAGD